MSNKVIVEFSGSDWMVLFPSGEIEVADQASDILVAVRRRDLRLAKKTGKNIVTTIEWRNVPKGFVPPIVEC